MPNRIIKESICTSDNLNELSWENEVLFYRLLVNCDDYGRMDARAPIVRARCFPLVLQRVSEKDITSGLASLALHKLIRMYSVDGYQYLQVLTWDKHQRIRAKRSKYPEPPADDSNSQQMMTDDSNSQQMIADDSISSRNPNPNPNPNKENIKEKNKYGQFKNVFLGDDEYEKLKEKFGEGLKDRIEELSEGIASKGYRYRNHYATLLSWDRKKKKEIQHAAGKGNPRPLIERTAYTRPEDY